MEAAALVGPVFLMLFLFTGGTVILPLIFLMVIFLSQHSAAALFSPACETFPRQPYCCRLIQQLLPLDEVCQAEDLSINQRCLNLAQQNLLLQPSKSRNCRFVRSRHAIARCGAETAHYWECVAMGLTIARSFSVRFRMTARAQMAARTWQFEIDA